MKKKTKTIGVLLTGIALAVGIAVSGGVIHNSHIVDEVKAGTSTVTVNGTYFSTTDETQTATIDGVTIGGLIKQYETTKLWLTSGSGFIYNSTDLGSITKLTLSYNSGGSASSVQRFNFGTSAMASYLSTGGTTRSVSTGGTSYDETGGVGKGFFNISVSKKNLQLSSLVIEYVSGPSGTLQSLSYTGNPTKTSYYAGESFDPTGMVITAHYDSSDTVVVTDDCTFAPNPLLAGTTDIQVAYDDGTNDVQLLIEDLIQVASRTLTSLQVTTNPTKMSYIVGENFDPAGMVITAHYDDESQVADYRDYNYSPSGELNTIGSQLITISDILDAEITTSLSVQVNEAPAIAELFISEYIEGGGNNKAIEIYNGTGASVSLSNYKLRVHANGATSTTNITLGSGTLADNDVYVIANPDSNSTILDLADSTQSAVAFNGNDAISLYKVSSAQNIDVIGTIGSDPGSQWTGMAANGSGSTLNNTLVRTTSTFGPNSTFTWSEWNAYAQDTFSYLGSHTVITSTPQHELDARTWGAGFLSATSSGCTARDQDALSTAWNGLETSYNALSSEAKGYLTSLTPNEAGNDAEHAVARYIYIITKYGDVTFNDFMNLGISSSSNNTYDIGDNTPNVAIILIVSLVGASVLVGYRLMPKKKED